APARRSARPWEDRPAATRHAPATTGPAARRRPRRSSPGAPRARIPRKAGRRRTACCGSRTRVRVAAWARLRRGPGAGRPAPGRPTRTRSRATHHRIECCGPGRPWRKLPHALARLSSRTVARPKGPAHDVRELRFDPPPGAALAVDLRPEAGVPEP